MGFIDDVKRWLGREAADAKEWVDASVERGHDELDQAERRLSDDPSTRMAALQDDIAANDQAFDSLRDKADAALARPQADADLVEDGVEETASVEAQEGRDQPGGP